jgi:hypothetical protein
MLEDYSKERAGLFEILKKAALVIPAVLIFVALLGLLGFFTGQLSTKDKKAFREQEEREKAFAAGISASVVDAGYVLKKAGLSEIYIPTLIVLFTNGTDKTREKLTLVADFAKNGKSFCSGSASLYNLQPWETRDAQIKCLEPTGFATFVTGMSLIETAQTVGYVLSVGFDRTTVTVAKGGFSFKIIRPEARPPT